MVYPIYKSDLKYRNFKRNINNLLAPKANKILENAIRNLNEHHWSGWKFFVVSLFLVLFFLRDYNQLYQPEYCVKARKVHTRPVEFES